jgi:predicted phage terminase large subunit-like protein
MKFDNADKISLLCKKNICESSLYEFVKMMWPHVAEGKQFIDNWHIRLICDHLQAITEGKIKNLIINIPFRCMKSLIASICWPAWEWTIKPHLQYIGVSYNTSMALSNARIMRTLISCDFYKSMWDRELRKDTDSMMENKHGGHRFSTGILSGTTGRNADRVIADDPHTAMSIYSEAERNSEILSWKEQFATRRNSEQSALVIVMQRLHYKDLSSIYFDNESYDLICLPMEYEGQNRCRSSLMQIDTRTEVGELLWPNRFSKEYLEKEYKTGDYTAYFIAAQLQQRPAPLSGGIIQASWFKYYDELPEHKKLTWTWDTAIKQGQSNDYSVGQLWASCENGYYLIHSVRKRLLYPELKELVKISYEQSIEIFGKEIEDKASEIIIEDKSSGQQLLQDFRSIGKLPVIATTPTGSKVERLNLVSGIFEAGKIFLPKGKPWVANYIEEFISFPTGSHDDQIDATTQYLTREKKSVPMKIRVF